MLPAWMTAVLLLLMAVLPASGVGAFPTYNELGLEPCQSISLMTKVLGFISTGNTNILTLNGTTPTLAYNSTENYGTYGYTVPSSSTVLNDHQSLACYTAVNNVFSNADNLLPCTTTTMFDTTAAIKLTPGVHCWTNPLTTGKITSQPIEFDAQHQPNARFYIRYQSNSYISWSHSCNYTNGASASNVIWLLRSANNLVGIRDFNTAVARGTFLVGASGRVNVGMPSVEGQVLYANRSVSSTIYVTSNTTITPFVNGVLGSNGPALPTYDELGLGPCKSVYLSTETIAFNSNAKSVTLNGSNPIVAYNTSTISDFLIPSTTHNLATIDRQLCTAAVRYVIDNVNTLLPCTTTDKLNSFTSVTLTPGVHCWSSSFVSGVNMYQTLTLDGQGDSNARFYVRYRIDYSGTQFAAIRWSHPLVYVNGATASNVMWIGEGSSNFGLRTEATNVARGIFLVRTDNMLSFIPNVIGQVLHVSSSTARTNIHSNMTITPFENGMLGSPPYSYPVVSSSSTGSASSSSSSTGSSGIDSSSSSSSSSSSGSEQLFSSTGDGWSSSSSSSGPDLSSSSTGSAVDSGVSSSAGSSSSSSSGPDLSSSSTGSAADSSSSTGDDSSSGSGQDFSSAGDGWSSSSSSSGLDLTSSSTGSATDSDHESYPRIPTYNELGLTPCRELSFLADSLFSFMSGTVQLTGASPSAGFNGNYQNMITLLPASTVIVPRDNADLCRNAINYLNQQADSLIPCNRTFSGNTGRGDSQTIKPGITCWNFVNMESVSGSLVFDALGNSRAKFIIRVTEVQHGGSSPWFDGSYTLVNGAQLFNIIWVVNAPLLRLISNIPGIVLFPTSEAVYMPAPLYTGQYLMPRPQVTLQPYRDSQTSMDILWNFDELPLLPSSSSTGSTDSSTGVSSSTGPTDSSSSTGSTDSSTGVSSSTGNAESSSTGSTDSSTGVSSSTGNAESSSTGPVESSSSTSTAPASSSSSTGSELPLACVPMSFPLVAWNDDVYQQAGLGPCRNMSLVANTLNFASPAYHWTTFAGDSLPVIAVNSFNARYTYGDYTPATTAVLEASGGAQCREAITSFLSWSDEMFQCTPSNAAFSEYGTITLTPGVYCIDNSAASYSIRSQLTLDGQHSENPMFVFKIKSTVSTASLFLLYSVSLVNGVTSSNVLWIWNGNVMYVGPGTFQGHFISASSKFSAAGEITVQGQILLAAATSQMTVKANVTVDWNVPQKTTSLVSIACTTRAMSSSTGASSSSGSFDSTGPVESSSSTGSSDSEVSSSSTASIDSSSSSSSTGLVESLFSSSSSTGAAHYWTPPPAYYAQVGLGSCWNISLVANELVFAQPDFQLLSLIGTTVTPTVALNSVYGRYAYGDISPSNTQVLASTTCRSAVNSFLTSIDTLFPCTASRSLTGHGPVTLTPGVYCMTTALGQYLIPDDSPITLDGQNSANPMFVLNFKAPAGADRLYLFPTITLTNGARPENVIWTWNGASVSIMEPHFPGIFISSTVKNMYNSATGSTMNGQLLLTNGISRFWPSVNITINWPPFVVDDPTRAVSSSSSSSSSSTGHAESSSTGSSFSSSSSTGYYESGPSSDSSGPSSSTGVDLLSSTGTSEDSSSSGDMTDSSSSTGDESSSGADPVFPSSTGVDQSSSSSTGDDSSSGDGQDSSSTGDDQSPSSSTGNESSSIGAESSSAGDDSSSTGSDSSSSTGADEPIDTTPSDTWVAPVHEANASVPAPSAADPTTTVLIECYQTFQVYDPQAFADAAALEIAQILGYDAAGELIITQVTLHDPSNDEATTASYTRKLLQVADDEEVPRATVVIEVIMPLTAAQIMQQWMDVGGGVTLDPSTFPIFSATRQLVINLDPVMPMADQLGEFDVTCNNGTNCRSNDTCTMGLCGCPRDAEGFCPPDYFDGLTDMTCASGSFSLYADACVSANTTADHMSYNSDESCEDRNPLFYNAFPTRRYCQNIDLSLNIERTMLVGLMGDPANIKAPLHIFTINSPYTLAELALPPHRDIRTGVVSFRGYVSNLYDGKQPVNNKAWALIEFKQVYTDRTVQLTRLAFLDGIEGSRECYFQDNKWHCLMGVEPGMYVDKTTTEVVSTCQAYYVWNDRTRRCEQGCTNGMTGARCDKALESFCATQQWNSTTMFHISHDCLRLECRRGYMDVFGVCEPDPFTLSSVPYVDYVPPESSNSFMDDDVGALSMPVFIAVLVGSVSVTILAMVGSKMAYAKCQARRPNGYAKQSQVADSSPPESVLVQELSTPSSSHKKKPRTRKIELSPLKKQPSRSGGRIKNGK